MAKIERHPFLCRLPLAATSAALSSVSCLGPDPSASLSLGLLMKAIKPWLASFEQLSTMAPKELHFVDTQAARDATTWGLLSQLRLAPAVFWLIKEHDQGNLSPLIPGEKGHAVA